MTERLRRASRRRDGRNPPVAVVPVWLDGPLRPLPISARHEDVELLAWYSGQVLGRVRVAAAPVLSTKAQALALADRFADAVWQAELRERLRSICGGEAADGPEPHVSVVVCTRDRVEDLERCLRGLLSLDPPAHEILVVDNNPRGEGARTVCEALGVRYVLEPDPGQSRARNRGIAVATGDVIAFTDDDCVPDSGWLAGLGAELADPLVQAVTGIVEPLELETWAQQLFEAHGGFFRGYERQVLDGCSVQPATAAGRAGAGANAIFRRSAFDAVGPFAEDLGPGTPARAADDNDLFCRLLAAGYRIVFDPRRLVWHRHRREGDAVRRTLFDYGASSTALMARRLVRHRELGALEILWWWWRHHFKQDFAAIVRRRPDRLPLRILLAEMGGTLSGPWLLARSTRSRRNLPTVELPPAPIRAASPPQVRGEQPAISVVIPTRGRPELLIRVLHALAAQRYPAHLIEAVVVDDGSGEGGDAARQAELPFDVQAIGNDGRGVGAARNAGLAAAVNPLLLFLDDDLVPDSALMATHAGLHGEASGPQVVLGYCPPVVDGSWWSLVLRAWWEDHYRRKAQPRHRWFYADVTLGNASLLRSLLLDLGGFDEAFTRRHEDWELGVRLLARGVRLVCTKAARAEHHLDTTFAAAVANQRQEARDDVELLCRHPGIATMLPLGSYAQARPRVKTGMLRRGPARAALLERVGARRAWWLRVSSVLGQAYLQGLYDAVPSDGEFHAMLGEVWDEAASGEISLGDSAGVTIPVGGAAELVVRSPGGRPIRVQLERVGQWDAEAAVDAVARRAGETIREGVVRRLLSEGTAPPEQRVDEAIGVG